MENNKTQAAFTAERIDVLSVLSSQAAISLQNAYLYENLELEVRKRTYTIEEQKREIEKQHNELRKELDLAGRIQRSLLPVRLPSIPGIDLSYLYAPMHGVGGDFVDYMTNDDGLLGLFVCDVSGHGVAAALLSSMVKMSLQGWEQQLTAPAEFLNTIADSLGDNLAGNFVTAGLGYIDTATGRGTVARAGHLPWLIVRYSGQLEWLKPKGGLISPFAPRVFEEMSFRLSPGDKLIIYTDGVTEARNSEGVMLEEGFAEILVRYRGLSAEEICRQVRAALENYTGRTNNFEDDITFGVMTYLGPE